MKFAPTQKWMTFALVAVAAIPVILSGEIGLLFQVALPAFGLIGWWLEPPLTQSRQFRRGVTGLLLLLFVVQTLRFTTGEPMAKMGMEIAAMLLAAKLCTRGYAADYYQIVALSFLHIIAATVATNDLSYAVSFLIFVALSSPVLALTHLRREMENRFSAEASDDSAEMLRRLLLSKRVVSPGFVLGSSLLSLPILIMTVVLFIIFPRVGFGVFGQMPDAQPTAGFGNEVKLSDMDLLRRDNAVLIRMEPIGVRKTRPNYLPIKLRGAVFDVYEDDVWKKEAALPWKKLDPVGNDFRFDPRHIIKPDTQGFEVLLESLEPPFLFVPTGTGLISTYPISRDGIPSARGLGQNRFGALRYRDEAKVGIRYKVFLTGVPPYGDPPDATRDFLQLPEGSERLVALARRFAGEGPIDVQKERIIEGLRNNYKYETKLADAEENLLEGAPLDRFLFSRKTGVCSHFATAFTLMLRGIGVPARMVTGFMGAEWNDIGGYYSVRKTSAHTWTEAFIDGKWVTLDATPAGDGGFSEDFGYKLAMFIDAFRMRWHKHVIGYDSSSQYELAVALRRQVIKLRKERAEQGKEGLPTWPFWTVLGLMVGAFLVVRLSPYWRRWTMPALARRRSRRGLTQATKLYQKLEGRLARRGYPRPKTLTPKEHLELLDHGSGELAEMAGQLVSRYNEVRFGGRALGADEIKQWRRTIQSL